MEDLIGQIEVDVLPSQRGEVYQMLCKVLANIAEKPAEPKYRTLKKENKKVADTLLRHPAAVSVLMAAGFEDQGDSFLCPESADVEALTEGVALLECIVASREGQDQPALPTAAAQPAAAVTSAPRPTASTAKAEKNPQMFVRRKDEEAQRQQAADQLASLRAARAQALAPQRGAPLAAAEDGSSPQDSGAKKPVKSAFDFENRRAKEEQRNQATESLEEMRRRQKEKFAEFQADPNARNADVYKQPPSVAAGGKTEQSWGDWFGGMFGGGSSGSGGSSKPSRPSNNDRPGPRVKGIGDLPKPVQRG